MRRRTSAGSIFWGVTLVVIGCLLLARNLGYAISIWAPLVKYWPVLIILWGCLKLVDFYRMQNDPEKRPLFSGGEVVMLIFVLFAGSMMSAAANMSPEIGQFFDFPSDFDFWDITGSTYTFTEHQELPAASGSTIKIFNMYGAVQVKPSDGDLIVLDVEKIVRGANKDEAETRAKDFTFSIKQEGSAYRIVSNRDENYMDRDHGINIRIGNERQRYKSNLTIRVPRKALLDLTNKYGAVSVDHLEGNQSITNKYGSTTIEEITGAITLSTGYGAVVLENVSGNATVTNGYASTTLRKIGGRVEIENKYGSVDVQDATTDVAIENRYSVVNVQRVGGNVTVKGRNNSVDIDDVGGSLDVETSYKNLNVRNAKGVMRLTNRHGGVDIELAQSPTNDITVNGSYSDVSLQMPAGAAFSINGQTRYGDINSEFDAISVNSSGRDRSVHGQQGSGGPRIVVETQHGDIRLDKRG